MHKFLKKTVAVALLALACVPFGGVSTVDAATKACDHKNLKTEGTHIYSEYESHTFETKGVSYTCIETTNYSKVVTFCMDCGTVFDEDVDSDSIHSNRQCPLNVHYQKQMEEQNKK